MADSSVMPVWREASLHSGELLDAWTAAQEKSGSSRSDLLNVAEQKQQAKMFLDAFLPAAGSNTPFESREWDSLRDVLLSISDRRTRAGFTAPETAAFIHSLKVPLFEIVRKVCTDSIADAINTLEYVTNTLDHVGAYTTELAQRRRDAIIERQSTEILELSTPVVRLWDNILALPLIGTLDSARTQVVMESLLNEIVTSGSTIAIIDITGVPTVDTLVAQHLLKTVAAARLMGADCIISGIRPQIAQTIVHLGVDLTGVITKASLSDAFRIALSRTNQTVVLSPAAD